MTPLLFLIGLVLIVLALTGHLGTAQNVIVVLILFVVLIVLLKWAGLA